MIKRLLVLLTFLALLLTGLWSGASTATADTAENEDGLCLVTPEKTEIIEHDAITVYESRWKQDIPAVDEVSHMEYRFYNDIPAVDEVKHSEYQFSRENPGKDEVSHLLWRFYKDIPAVDETFTTWYRWKLVEPTTVPEYRYKKIIPAVDGVQECQYKKWVKDYTTEYKYAKYTQTKTRTSEVWANFAPNDKHGTFEGPPSWPTDPNGKWIIHNDIPGGHVGPDGVYQKGVGNSSWFYRHGAGDWSDFGPWTLWSPLSHISWETFDQPSIGDPAFHADGSNDGTDWYRQWQVRSTGETRQVENGGHWEYQWFTEDPGEGWTKTEECRWKVEPVAEQTVWFPSEDGWTKEVKGEPWIKTDERTVPGADSVTWFPSEDGWTKEVKDSPWVKVAEEARSNEDGIPGYRLYLTNDEPSKDIDDAVWLLTDSVDGWTVLDSKKIVDSEAIPPFTEYRASDGSPSTDISDAAWFKENAFEGWAQFNSKVVIDTVGVPGYREYKTATGTTLVLDEASWFKENAFEGWTQLDSKKVVDSEFIPGYTIYFLEGGEPTLTLTDANWTTVDPADEAWVFIDERDREIKAAWNEKVVTPAEYEECDEPELAFTGASDAMPLYLGAAGLLALLGFGLLRFRRSS